ncbi:hypothetical protein HJC10_19445 [Corallococcus exiguus]|uniref:Uncharacterized protein n=1 Tax=Corallococcus exiguus TaxID=83462 RepID=A0A7X4YEZ5_9BACT|nr:hypothetical protein [Corallococcus exiguus]RKH24353.1 hypothetical protein D7V77_21130 [Corallococcus sp. CA041A]RKH87400.1 hypothetical protein D7X99_00780 [Corallococcus sp. AB032C]NNB85973.1 hypothetical protein [Corallococcus exiguus]NNB93987.1 hypothetical protein [Corallococcus exiguus]
MAPIPEAIPVSTDQKGTRILARTFFNQLRASGYTPHQVIGIATELLELVTTDLKEGDKAVAAAQSTPAPDSGAGFQQRV